MWIFTSDGFLSVVADAAKPAGDRLLVRGRMRDHISKHFPHAEIIENAGSDYAFRAWVPRDQVKALMMDQIDGLNYSNFKNSIADDPYHDACLGTWQVMRDYQTWEAHQKKRKIRSYSE